MNNITDKLWGAWGLILALFVVAFLAGLFWVIFTRGNTKWGWFLLVVGLIGSAIEVLWLSQLRGP